MTDEQKAVAHYLLRQSYAHGFGVAYPLGSIASDMGVTIADIYDEDTETGFMWEYGPFGDVGLIEGRRGSLAVVAECRGLLETWSDYRGY